MAFLPSQYRTTEEAVEGILDTYDGFSLTPFIDTAQELVEEVCASDEVDPAYSLVRLELIERWLAAHFYCIRDPRTTTDQIGQLQESYQSKVDLGFDVTHYGQQAMRLDTNGGLAVLNNSVKETEVTLPAGKPKTSVTWLGTTYR